MSYKHIHYDSNNITIKSPKIKKYNHQNDSHFQYYNNNCHQNSCIHNSYKNNGHNDQNRSSSSIRNANSLQKLNKKIKLIKSALKIAQQHNQQLHYKLTQIKKEHQRQKIKLQEEANKFKQLYEMLIQKYQQKSGCLKQIKKKLKKHQKIFIKNKDGFVSLHFDNQKQQNLHDNCHNDCENTKQKNYQKNNSNHYLDADNMNKRSKKRLQFNDKQITVKQKTISKSENKSISRQIEEILTKQQIAIQHLNNERKMLKQELQLKNRKLTQYQRFIQELQSEENIRNLVNNQTNYAQLNQLSYKIQILQTQKSQYLKQKQTIYTKMKRLQVELQATKHLKQSLYQDNMKIKKQLQSLKLQFIMKQRSLMQRNNISQQNTKWKQMYEQTNKKYHQVLRFSYQIQKDFQRQLHTMAKQFTRREIVKNADND